jgi:hypothetical protein
MRGVAGTESGSFTEFSVPFCGTSQGALLPGLGAHDSCPSAEGAVAMKSDTLRKSQAHVLVIPYRDLLTQFPSNVVLSVPLTARKGSLTSTGFPGS